MRRALVGKSLDELESLLASTSHEQLVRLIHQLVTFDRLLTAREISDASHVCKTDVLDDMHAGRFVDPLFGPGFFCRSLNSTGMRVTASAANEWRRLWFVPRRDLPSGKKERGSQTGDDAISAGQKAVRDLSPEFLERARVGDDQGANGGSA